MERQEIANGEYVDVVTDDATREDVLNWLYRNSILGYLHGQAVIDYIKNPSPSDKAETVAKLENICLMNPNWRVFDASAMRSNITRENFDKILQKTCAKGKIVTKTEAI